MTRSSFVWTLALLVALASSAMPSRGAARPEWKAGAAGVVITPKRPTWMAGYAARKKPSEGTAQELYAKALALEDRRGYRVVLVTSDLLGFVRSVAEPIAERAQQRYGLSRERILFSASHTHAGPVIRESLSGMYALEGERTAAVQAYTQQLQEQVLELIGAALKDLAPARLSLGRGRAEFAINRRLKREKGFVISVNPEGPVDHEVTVLRVERPDGSLRAALFSYACHNTTLGADFYQFHGDYAGAAQEVLQKAHPGAVALFMAGCGGDANPNPRGTIELARQHGESLAAAVEKSLAGTLRPIRGPLRAVFDRVDLPFATPPSRQELEARLEDKDVYRQRHAKAMLAIIEQKGQLPSSYPYPIQVLQFDKDLTLVALGGEVVVDYALRLKRELGAERLLVVAYSNDVMAYIPSRRVLEEGGYEGGGSMIYYGQPGPWAPPVEEVLVAKVHELVKKAR